MISANCDIREFISELENKDFFEMIYLLDKEATEAERQLYNPKSEMSEKQICGAEYASNLKNLIFYLRYGARPRGLKQEDLNLLQSVCEKNRIWELHWFRPLSFWLILTLLAGCRKLKKALIGSIPDTIIINNNGAIDTAGEMLVKYLSKYGLNSKQDYGR